MKREYEWFAALWGDDEDEDSLAERGVFLLVSTEKLDKDELLSRYAFRERAGKAFEVAVRGDTALLADIQSDEVFRGYLLMRFLVTAAKAMMAEVISKSVPSLTVGAMLEILHAQCAIQYEEELITTEPFELVEEVYRAFGLTCPDSISLPVKGA